VHVLTPVEEMKSQNAERIPVRGDRSDGNSRSGSAYGRGLRRMAFTRLNIVTLAAMPTEIDVRAAMVKTGNLKKLRIACRRLSASIKR
jgi:hypothetical protein